MSAEPPAVGDLERNDIDGALAVYLWYLERGEDPPEDIQEVLCLLQDDSGEELLERVRALRH